MDSASCNCDNRLAVALEMLQNNFLESCIIRD